MDGSYTDPYEKQLRNTGKGIKTSQKSSSFMLFAKGWLDDTIFKSAFPAFLNCFP